MTRSVRRTREFERIANLPRREWEGHPAIEKLCDELTKRLRTRLEVPPQVPMHRVPRRLLPAQCVSMSDACTYRGGLVPLVTGGGKTLLSFLLPEVLGAKRALLLTKKALLKKTYAYLADNKPYWRIRPIEIVNYELLPHHRTLLTDHSPDLIILDEAHALKSRKAARTKIFREWRRKNPLVPVVAMSGSFMGRDYRDFAHIARWCLGDNTPLPLDYYELEEWAYATAEKIPEELRIEPGILLELGESPEELGQIKGRLLEKNHLQTDLLTRARKAVATRIRQTPGVVSTRTALPNVGLRVTITRLPLSPKQKELIGQLVKTNRVPDGEFCEEPLDIWRHMRSLSCGFWQHWKEQPPEPWLEAKRNWTRYVLKTLERSRTYAAPMHVAQAVRQGRLGEGLPYLQVWEAQRENWEAVPVIEWICDSTIAYCAHWLTNHPRGIAWSAHIPVGTRLESYSSYPYFREQACDSLGRYMGSLGTEGPAIASVKACAEGLELQHNWSDNLLISPGMEAELEQWISRTHRVHQPEDDVTLEVLIRSEGDERAWRQALADARNVTDSMAQPRRLAIATFENGEMGNGN